MPELIPVLPKKEIEEKVAEVGRKISSDYKGRELILIGILKGAFVFLSDLSRQISIPVKIDFLQVSSYGASTASSGKIMIKKKLGIDISGSDVLIVEDIVDSGLTMSYLIDYLKSFNPTSVKVCTMIDKKERRETDIKIDYVCHEIDEGFLVGYGLDWAEYYRNLPEIYHLKIGSI